LTANGLAGRLADLAVAVGANVQPGQIVAVSADVGHEEFARELAARAYRAGAKFVDVGYFAAQVKRARIEHADGDTLEFVPPWYGRRVFSLGESHAARIVIAAPTDPHALDGLDPVRLGRDPLPAIAE
jgi:aminopeptidase